MAIGGGVTARARRDDVPDDFHVFAVHDELPEATLKYSHLPESTTWLWQLRPIHGESKKSYIPRNCEATIRGVLRMTDI